MKRILIPGLMLVAALALTNCAEQLETPLQENDIVVEETMGALSEDCVPYEVFVESAETKTNNQDGRTLWIEDEDEIALFHKKTDGKYQYHSKFVYTGAGAFRGNLVNSETLADKNDWYAIYPYNSSSAATISAYPVTIGAELQTQTQAGSMYDIAGPNCPLYGIKNGVSRKNAPKFKMSHMFAVIALNIVNEGHGGNIAVKSAGITAAEEIVGDFDVNILGNPSKNIYDPVFTKKTNSKKSTKVELSNAVVIESGKSATLYLAVKPFDASGKELTISINGDAKKGNGASKTITMPVGSKFEAGKVTTITVPVNKLSFHNENVDPATSNVMNVKATGLKAGMFNSWSEQTKNAVVFNNTTEETIIVNGKEVQAYVIGSDGKTGSVTISGKAKELFPYIPIEFYATSFGDKAVMRVDKISVGFNFKILITIKQIISMTYADLTEGDDPLIADVSKIRFSGLLPLERVTVKENGADHKYAVILDEQPYHKPLSEQKVSDLLKNFDDNLKDDKVPTFEGLRDALLNPALIDSEGTPANITANNVFNKLHKKLAGNETVADVFDWLMGSNATDFFTKVGNLPIEVTLTTLTEDGADPRIIVWGLNSPAAE